MELMQKFANSKRRFDSFMEFCDTPKISGGKNLIVVPLPMLSEFWLPLPLLGIPKFGYRDTQNLRIPKSLGLKGHSQLVHMHMHIPFHS